MKRWFGWLLPLVLLANSCLLPVALGPASTTAPIATNSGVNLEVLGHVGGAAISLALRDHYALLGLSYELIVLDLANPARPQWVAALPISANDIALAGRYAYVVGRDSFAVVEVGDLTDPVLVNVLALPNTGSVVVVTTDYAYVAVYGDLYTIALANPTKPAIIGVNRLTVRITGMAVAANELYVVTDDDFQRLDISNPTQPIVVEMLADPRLSYGPVIAAGVLYFGNKAALQVRAVAGDVVLRTLALSTTLDWSGDIAIMDGIAYLAGGFQGLHVWDITDPTTAVAIGAYPLNGLAKAVVAQDGYVYTIDCDEGLRIFDAANPTALTAVGAFTPMGLSYNLTVGDAFAYVAGGYAGRLHQVALTNPAQVHTIAGHLLRSEVNDLAIVDNYLYVTVEAGVGVIDLAAPVTPQVVAFYPSPNAWAITAVGAYIYVSDPDGNLGLLDRTEPTQLTMQAAYPALGYANSVAVAGGLVYIAHKDVGLRLLAMGEQGELTVVGRYPLASTIRKIVVVNGYAYLAIGKEGLAVVDVTEPTAPHLVSRYEIPGEARDLAVQWPYLLVAAGAGGLQVLDIRDPLHLVGVARHQSCDGAYQVVSANGLLYVMQPLGGLWVLRLTGP